jgi:predicted nuclease of predicted toxin-antitoxin system
VKLLFDENLSYRLVDQVATLWPESAHIAGIGLLGRSDEEIWSYAQA